MLALDKLLKIPGVDPDYGYHITPGGDTLAFSWNASGQWELYTLSLKNPSTPLCITQGAGAKFAPCWSPDGANLAYVLDLDGGEKYDIYLYNTASGKHTNLTPNTDYAIQPVISWSPDGAELVFAADVSGKFEAYRMTLADGAIHRLVPLEYPVYKVNWSPTGEIIAVMTQASGQDFFTYLVSVDDGTFYPIAINNKAICALDSAWSPDGSRLVFASNVGENYQIGIFDLASREITWLTHNDRENEHPKWSPDGHRITYISQSGPLTNLVVQSVDGTTPGANYQIAEGIHYLPIFTPDSRQVVTAFDSPCHPDDLWLLSLESGQFRQLTDSLPAEFQKVSLVTPQHIRYTSLDGKSVPALLFLPENRDKPHPAVIYIHGGPNWLAQYTWDPLIQHMVSRGWVVLAPNYRGSTGYGKVWQLANRFDLGGGDTGDIAAAAEYLMTNYQTEIDRIAVTGRSYGGYLTMTSLTEFPDLWAGGSAVVPFLNWFTGHENSRQDLQHWDLENFGDPLKDEALYRQRSPYFFLDRIQAPVQFVCGAHDPRCPASESIQAHETLLSMGKPCELALYPDEGHVFLKIENVVNAKQRQVDFLARLFENKGTSQ